MGGSSGSDMLGTSAQEHSTMLFLSGGIGAMLALVLIALLILACSLRSQARRTAREAIGEEVRENHELARVEDEGVGKDEVLVIMAGDDRPTFLARPVEVREKKTSSAEPRDCWTKDDRETKDKEEGIP